MLGVFVGLVLGPPRCRGVRTWLLATGLVSCWCGLISSWSTLYWEGQQFRLSQSLHSTESLASSLKSAWPQADGETLQLGCFLAYPKHAPSSLMLLGGFQLHGVDAGVAAIEKTDDGAIVFELTGPEAGAWLEWREDGSEPKSFVGGLQTQYTLVRWASLGPRWRLVRYRLSTTSKALHTRH